MSSGDKKRVVGQKAGGSQAMPGSRSAGASVSLEDIVSLAKRRGFIFPSSEIYGGLAGVYDYGPLGVMLKHNIENLWWNSFVIAWDDIYPLDAAILMNPKVWEASGHVAGFTDPMVEDLVTKKRYRADHLAETDSTDLKELAKLLKGKKSPDGNPISEPKKFNMMLETQLGAIEASESVSYLRPETAQGIFVNYKNVVDSFSPDIPFGIGQIGKAFRNEISPRDWLFRQREFEQMELQYFINPAEQETAYEEWRKGAWDFLTKNLQIDPKQLRWHEHSKDERAHYAAAAHDIEFNFPFGFKELWGTHNRTNFDLTSHQKHSGKNLEYRPKDGGKPYIPYVIESSVGLDRLVLATLTSAYTEDEVNGEKRIYLKFPDHIAPYKVAVLPLVKNKPELTKKAREVYKMLKDELGNVMWVDSGNIGKNYRKMDEIGTPWCITIDFDTLSDGTVTLRNRDTTKQERVKINDILSKL